MLHSSSTIVPGLSSNDTAIGENIQGHNATEKDGLRGKTKTVSFKSQENPQISVYDSEDSNIPVRHKAGSSKEDTKSRESLKTSRTSGITNQNIRHDIRQRILLSSGNRMFHGSRSESSSKQ